MLHTSPIDEPGTKDAGGMNVVVRAQAEELARLGHRVRLITRRSAPDQPAEVELMPGLSVVHLAAGPARVLPKGDHEALIAPFGAALADHLSERPADLIHAEHWYSGLAALPYARAAGVPLVQSYHSIAADESTPLTEGERPEAAGRLEGERRLAREADLVVTVSEAERDTVLGRLGGDPARVAVVHPGVDTAVFRPRVPADQEHDPARARHKDHDADADYGDDADHGGDEPRGVEEHVGADLAGADPGVRGVHDTSAPIEDRQARRTAAAADARPEVLVVGRLDPLKGFDLAIAAVASIAEAHRPRLGIIGAPPPDGDAYVRALHEAAAASDMGNTVAFAGALGRPALAERMREAALVLIPSHSETFGLVALEAAASGVPVVARATGGLLEAVVDGETGLLVSGDDPATWAAAIERVLREPELAERMRVAARQCALARSWEASTRELLAAYRSVI